ncbi:MAG: HAD family phosphatase [Candidatus Marinimicrobia bacterium]|nr:HAD family phosphatase [Candidatus Neomarinimicrobiota bacterium]MCF7828340.1 HAD family phosphatase [Candidatus Neomarinimicrobiota bacterium]MCF7879485.1 HAD family phosphatase [Candidatus Neomarinimicrobiota bacterium]
MPSEQVTPKYRTVIWDMDGVLIDSERHWNSLDSLFLEDVVNDWEAFDQSRLVGRSLGDIYELLAEEYGISISKDEYLREYNRVARRIYGEKASLMPNVQQTLHEIDALGVAQCLASSSSREWIGYALERFPLGEFFDHIVSADDVGGRGKPDPAIYEYTCKTMACTKDATIVIEDSEPGVKAAQGAGLTVIGYSHKDNTQSLESAEFHVSDLLEIPEIVSGAGNTRH